MTMEKSWVMIMKDQTDKNTKSRRKFVPQVRCGVLEGAVCDLETGVNTDGWRRVTSVDDRVD